MKIKTINFYSQKDKENLTSVFVLDDNDGELEHYTFYNHPSEIKVQPELVSTIKNLPAFLEKIYNAGKSGENIEFSKEEIKV